MDPIYRLPPHEMEHVLTPLSEIVDWSQTFIGLPEAWKLTAGEGMLLAILDTGVNMRHPDLDGQVIDARDFTGSRVGPADVHGHGTWCTSACVASANDIGIRGGCYKAKAVHAKVLGDNGSGSDASIEQGMMWAASKGAHVFSLSLGGPQMSDRLHRLFIELAAQGKFIFAAAGNDGRGVNYPAAWPECVAVGAVGPDGRLTRFSSRGSRLDILAPGVDMLGCGLGSSYVKMTGTSMAAPLAAAVGTLALAKHAKAGGRTELANVNDMREHLKATSNETLDGYGLINPGKLLERIKGQPQADVYPFGPFEITLGPVALKIYAKLS